MSNSRFAEALEQRTLLSAGDLDQSFGSGGIVSRSFGGEIRSVATVVQSDNKVIVAMNVIASEATKPSFVLARFARSGRIDKSFGKSGKVVVPVANAKDNYYAGPVIDGKGRILVLDHGQLMRFTSAGKLDNGFDGDGIITRFNAQDIAVRKDGKFFACVGRNVERFLANGKLDKTFGNQGKVLMEFDLPTGPGFTPLRPDELALQHDGSITVGVNGGGPDLAYTPGIVRIRSNGKIDRRFGKHGLRLGHALDFVEHVAALPAGRIAFTSFGEDGFDLLTVLDSTGEPDKTFAEDGSLFINPMQGFFGASVFATRGDKLIVDPFVSEDIDGNKFFMGVTRLNFDGQRDRTFGDVGQVVHEWAGVTAAPDGDIVLFSHENNLLHLERIKG